MDLEALFELLRTIAELDDTQLTDAQTQLAEAAGAIDPATATDDDIALLQRIAESIETVRTELATRETAAAEREQTAADLLQRIAGEDEGGEGAGGDGDGDGGEGDAGAGDGAGGEGTEGDGAGEGEGDGAGEGVETPEAIAAAATAAASARSARTRVSRVAARRPAQLAGVRRETTDAVADGLNIRELGLVASANAGADIPAGSPINDWDTLANIFMSAFDASEGFAGPGGKVRICRAGTTDLAHSPYPEDRRLGRDAVENFRRLERIKREHGTHQSITAAGGVCAPVPVMYDQPTIGTTARPMRDSGMVRMGAERSGVKFMPVPILDDVEDAVDIWTLANDTTPGSDGPSTKSCIAMTCPDEETEIVQAITKCLTVGNFRAQYFPEQVAAWLRLVAVRAARVAEIELISKVADGSTHVNVGQLLGTTRDVLAGLDRATAGYASRWRTDPNVGLRWAAPFWLRNQVRTDLARELPGSTDERLAVADAQIEAFLTIRNITPTWLLDGEAGQIFGAQSDGPLLGWPSTAITYLYPAAEWAFLDGGSLDFGLMRDTVTTQTNDAKVFAEFMEGALHHGNESFRLVFDTCPDGSTSATKEINPCTTGS